jgi:hypothetical protein
MADNGGTGGFISVRQFVSLSKIVFLNIHPAGKSEREHLNIRVDHCGFNTNSQYAGIVSIISTKISLPSKRYQTDNILP